MAESLRERQREAVERLCAKSPKGKPVETGTENAPKMPGDGVYYGLPQLPVAFFGS